MIFQKNHFLYRLLIYTKRILMTRKICQIAKSAKRRCKVSSYNQQVQLFLNQGLATGNLQYLVLDLAEGVHLEGEQKKSAQPFFRLGAIS